MNLLTLRHLFLVPWLLTLAAGTIDHHVHILGPDVMRDWRAVGVTFSRPDSIYMSAATLLGGGDDAIGSAVLVPMGHLYATEDFVLGLRLDLAEEQRRVARENDFVAREARRHAGRAVALCSVPALRPYAMTELRRCDTELRSAGLKLHLASSQVDLENAAHLAVLDSIMRFAAGAGLPVLLHLDPQRRGLDTADIRRFAERVLEPHPSLVVMVAHLGGSGGYGPWTRSVFLTMRSWQRRVEADGAPKRQLWWDLSAVVLERESEGVPATTPVQVARLRDDLREQGIDRARFGSDYPVFTPARGLQVLRDVVGLTEDEVARIARPASGAIFKPRN